MTVNTETLNLTLYDRTADTLEKVIDFRDTIAGTGESNMKKIDQFARRVLDELNNSSVIGEDGTKYRFGVDATGIYIMGVDENV